MIRRRIPYVLRWFRYQLVLQINKIPGSTSTTVWPEAEYVIDAKRKGNIGRFLNPGRRNGCNVFPQVRAFIT